MKCVVCGDPADDPIDVTVTEAGVEFEEAFCGGSCFGEYLVDVFGETVAREVGKQLEAALAAGGVSRGR